MPYNKNVWVAPQGNNLNRFIKQNETPTHVNLIQDPELTNNPTPFSPEWMNHLEDGVEAVHNLVDRIGELHFFEHQPTIQQMTKWRMLALNYQIIKISDYQEICDLKWVGSGANATADWWYRCDANGTRNVSGQYMRVADWRGMFPRGAGANAIKKGANNTPYNGFAIGNFTSDAMRRIYGSADVLAFVGNEGTYGSVTLSTREGYWGITQGSGRDVFSGPYAVDPSLIVPETTEFRPASISALVCMSY